MTNDRWTRFRKVEIQSAVTGIEEIAALANEVQQIVPAMGTGAFAFFAERKVVLFQSELLAVPFPVQKPGERGADKAATRNRGKIVDFPQNAFPGQRLQDAQTDGGGSDAAAGKGDTGSLGMVGFGLPISGTGSFIRTYAISSATAVSVESVRGCTSASGGLLLSSPMILSLENRTSQKFVLLWDSITTGWCEDTGY